MPSMKINKDQIIDALVSFDDVTLSDIIVEVDQHLADSEFTKIMYVYFKEQFERDEANKVSVPKEDDRDSLIGQIEMLYPADDNEAGRELIFDTLCKGWRNLPTEILRVYLSLCKQRDGGW